MFLNQNVVRIIICHLFIVVKRITLMTKRFLNLNLIFVIRLLQRETSPQKWSLRGTFYRECRKVELKKQVNYRHGKKSYAKFVSVSDIWLAYFLISPGSTESNITVLAKNPWTGKFWEYAIWMTLRVLLQKYKCI